jgi:hypothetical protein
MFRRRKAEAVLRDCPVVCGTDRALNIFIIDWKNIQLNSAGGGVILRAHGDQAKVDDFEFAATARPGRHTAFSAYRSYQLALVQS